MRNRKGLLIDAAAGFVLTLVVMSSYWLSWPVNLSGVEFKAYDLRSSWREILKTPEEIVLVAIDDDSIAQIGRWPWPRSRIAAALDKISEQHPRVVGLDILYSEPERDPGLAEIKRLQQRYDELVSSHQIIQRAGAKFDAEFSSSTVALDSDSRLLASIRSAGDIVLPLFFTPNPTQDKPNSVDTVITGTGVSAGLREGAPVPTETKLVPPLASYAAAASGLAHINVYPEEDGVFRRDAPLILHNAVLYPSLSLRLVMSYHGLKPADVKFKPGVEITAGRLRLPLDAESRMPVTFLGPPGANTVKHVSFQAVMNGGVSADYFKDKIVIIGPTARGVGNEHAIPLGPGMADVEIVAHSVENILKQHFLTRPPWAPNVEWAMLAAIGFFLMVMLPRMKAFWGLVVSLLLAVMIGGAGTYFFVQGQWIKIGYALALLLCGFLVIVSRQFLLAEKGKELVEASAIETNKMLGLSFQGQGMLDMAFEKFRLCPLDGAMKELLYNLALDFERKRQFGKAAAVLEHISATDAKYKDVAEKTKKLKAASQGAVFGGIGGRKESTVLLQPGGAKPTLGRYEVEKELGRGAMGVVYLGRDPKINRQVAIKTMMLEESADGTVDKETKERFFREAESAGTLNHPNIVRIFDAGEEGDVAYIAMELLDGQDFTQYCAKDHLLPLDKVLEYVATVADALDYAHRQGIVHRDIKPANFMLLKDGSIRVADFGIARITASSKTASGTVMGTPSYMSPEQVAGRKVDGRSDLFSLSVALYELVTGEKPFKGGDGGIGTLLFQIANDPHPDPLMVRSDLPPSLKAVIDKGLAKAPAQRFQRGAEMATALRSVLAESKAGSLETILPTAPEEEKKAPTYVPLPTQRPPAAAAAPAPAPADATMPAAARAAVEEKTITMPVAATPVPEEVFAEAENTLPAGGGGPEVTITGLNDETSVEVPAEVPAEAPVETAVEAPVEAVADPLGDAGAQAFPEQIAESTVEPAIELAAEPAAEPAAEGESLTIELAPRAGVGAPVEAPPPLEADGSAPQPDAALHFDPNQAPDATLRIAPRKEQA